MRITFDAPANQIQICPAASGGGDPCGSPVPRSFTVGDMTGTLTFPAVFNGSMLSSGDVTITDLPITMVVGGTMTTVRVTLTTALVAVNGAVVEGAPLEGLNSVTLVGVPDAAALPPPLAGQSVLLSLSCLPRPVPDKGQLAPPIQAASLRGQISERQVRLHAIADVSSVSPPDLTTGPALLAVDVGGKTVASAVLPGGLRGGRTIIGSSDDGRTALTVRSVRRGATSQLVMTARLLDVTLPPQTAGAPVLVDLILDLGGVIGRGQQLFHVSRDGRRLRAG
jgi:hypothetical protein